MFHRHSAVWITAALICLATACATGRFGPSPTSDHAGGVHTLKRLSVAERDALLRRAQVWAPIDTSSLDLARGPGLSPAEQIPDELDCRFVFPDKPLSGNTPKFLCAPRRDDAVKVKYGVDNGEVYAEVASSRLFWALGFGADRMYPVRVVCEDCPDDPYAASKQDWHIGRPANGGRHVFNPAAVERPLPGVEIDVPHYEGWAWPELEKVSPRAGGAPRAHVDALKLLAVFVQHSDSKPEQQRLSCAARHIRRDRQGNETCTRPWLVVSDLGTTFGKATFLNRSKMDLSDWSSAAIWHSDRCTGDLPRSVNGSLDSPHISEGGRRFLAARLSLLSDRQLADLFTAARAEQRGGTIDEWVSVFKRKREEIVRRRCTE